jgi:hypothetical protein
VGGRLVSKHL